MRKHSRQASGKVDLAGSENAPVRARLAPDGHLSRVKAAGIIEMSCAKTSCCDEAATGAIASENVAALGRVSDKTTASVIAVCAVAMADNLWPLMPVVEPSAFLMPVTLPLRRTTPTPVAA